MDPAWVPLIIASGYICWRSGRERGKRETLYWFSKASNKIDPRWNLGKLNQTIADLQEKEGKGTLRRIVNNFVNKFKK